ncbi:SDR family NAD(P)-dependent oxidoreductase [Persicimonas caeni]|uniref:SDR family NAD(P)-dependent oxidoreductase n=1 Tax=Persicimonas caeni TaxID=2292766 RepID=A0A4Y6PW01_PERCE|nr:SDR family NAD(P)-dependent oxidoreductase [Persicimonas caeni]QDG52423.1 SDR family NAD(P)-dependent oxidoreductase [Persicimonas caeni]QED33645.1 SDR family NAD(P)-dependent oxidoreductase [Persicimonas caeni]
MEAGNLLSFAVGLAAGYLGIQRFRADDLSGKTVLITGGSKGLGFVLARDFARMGCPVAICARDEEELDIARRRLEDEDAQVVTGVCDVADQAQVDRFVGEVAEAFGPVDILVNNAGIIQVGPVENLDVDDFEMAMDTMFWGVLHPTRAVLPQMLARGEGRIVNITSIGGKVSVPHLLPYCCAKFAAVGFSEGLRAEMAGRGVDIITIAPGLMRTGSHVNALFKGKRDEEFTWFSMGAGLPMISMNVERAARRIIAATKRGSAERVLSAPAKLLSWFHGLLPGTTTKMMGAINRLVLPSADGAHQRAEPGSEVYDTLDDDARSLLDTFAALGQKATEQFQNLSRRR